MLGTRNEFVGIKIKNKKKMKGKHQNRIEEKRRMKTKGKGKYRDWILSQIKKTEKYSKRLEYVAVKSVERK